MTADRSIGSLVALGSRSAVVEYGAGAVAKIPLDSTPDSWIRYESQYAAAARACGAPVPSLLDVETLAGRTISVWERVRGDSLWQLLIGNRIDPEACGEVLASVHRQLLQLVAPVMLPLQADRLTVKLRGLGQLGTAITPAMTRNGPIRLCHGDVHPGNILMGKDGPSVIDWFDACRGDALGDIARTAALLDPDQDLAHLPGATRTEVARLLRRYLFCMGVDPEQTPAWAPWVTLNRVARTGEAARSAGDAMSEAETETWIRSL